MSTLAQQTSGAQESGHCGAVVEKIAAHVIAEFDERPLAAVDAHPGAGAHTRGRQIIGAAAGEEVHVLPIQRLVALVRLGLPDPRAFLGGVLGTERQHRGERLLLPEHSDRAEPEVTRLNRPEMRQVQRAVRLDPLDEHRQFVHVRHDPRPGAGASRDR